MKRNFKSLPIMRVRERGAVAVEFALITPFLLLLIAGIVEFSHSYNIQISVTQAAREAARTYAITNDWDQAVAAGTNGAPGLDPAKFTFTSDPGACSPSANMEVTASYQADSLTGFSLVVSGNSISVADTITITGVGAMRCGG